MPQWLSPELIAIVAFGALILAALLMRGRGAKAGAGAPAVPDAQAAVEAARLIHERDAALRAQEEARAALETERASLRQTAAELQKAREDLREATVRAQDAAALKERAAAAETRAHDAEKALESALAGARERDRAHQEKVQELIAFRADMEKQFKALSGEALAAQSEAFGKTNKERMEALLSPLREQIGNFQSAFVQDGQARTEQSSSLKTMIESLTRETGKTQETAENLARALKGSSQAQGAWGEMILQTILEKSGLRDGEEYITQQSHTLEDGARLRPDVVVNLPGGQKLVIDSKVSLLAFNECVNCEDDTQRPVHVKAHVASLRGHIRGLAAKDYSNLHGGVDFVVLFVPIEAALSLAVQNDAELTGHAAASNVMLASPNTLIMALRTVQNLWRIERQNQNAQEIADRAGRLYEKFVGFVEDLEKVGDTIMRAHAQYESAHSKLRSGSGNLVRQAEMLKQLGARTSKTIPERTLSVADQRDEAEAPPRPDAQHPERVPALEGERAGKARDFDDLTSKEKFVAASISQDTDA